MSNGGYRDNQTLLHLGEEALGLGQAELDSNPQCALLVV